MLTLVRPEPHVPAPRQASRRAGGGPEGPVIRTSLRAPGPGAQTVASDAGVTAEWAAMAWVSEDGRWWLCRERPGPTHFAELVALAAAVSHHPDQRLRVLTDLDALARLVAGWRDGRVHRWPSLYRTRDARLERVVAVLQRRVAERAGRHDEVTATHVRGHSGHPLNTAADRLARHALTSVRIDQRRCQEIVDSCLGRPRHGVGGLDTRLVLLDVGPDGTAIAESVRARHGAGCALVLQDDLSHAVLGRRDRHAAELVARTAAFALDAGQHVVCVGAGRWARDRCTLVDLARRHRGTTTLVRTPEAHAWPDAAELIVHEVDHAGDADVSEQVVLRLLADGSGGPRRADRRGR